MSDDGNTNNSNRPKPGSPPGDSPGEPASDQSRSGVPDLEALFNPHEQTQFRRLCIPTDADELMQMGDTIQMHVQQVKANALPATDSEMAELLGERLRQLVASSDSLDGEGRSLVRGAIEYFLLASDADDDLSDALGFDDDVRVFNSVVRQLDRPALAIHLADLD